MRPAADASPANHEAEPPRRRRVAIAVSDYHAAVTSGLEAGARQALAEGGIGADAIGRFVVPGAFELPQAAMVLAESGAWEAVICLGCLIRGETPHFDYIARAAAHGIMRAAQATGVPVLFGVLTTNTMEEAMARSADNADNKGREAAIAALAMVRLYSRLAPGS